MRSRTTTILPPACSTRSQCELLAHAAAEPGHVSDDDPGVAALLDALDGLAERRAVHEGRAPRDVKLGRQHAQRDAHPLGLGGDVLDLLAVGVNVRGARLAVAHVADPYDSCQWHRGHYAGTLLCKRKPTHFGYARNTGSASVGYGGSSGDGESAVPSFVPPRFHDAIVRASQRWNVGAALLSAQIYAESGFNPFARSPGGRAGDRAVHARHGAVATGSKSVRSRRCDRRPGPPDERPAPTVRRGPAGARRLQRRRRGGQRYGGIPPTPRPAPT